jgi:DeoR/GlpR family transcriptional regulator of sugar metabolism
VAAKDRLQTIKQMVTNEKKVQVTQLSQLFQVTEETIRRDLEKLEAEGIITRTYGAVLNSASITDNVHFYKRAKSFLKRSRLLR